MENGRLDRLENMLEGLMGRSVREKSESHRVGDWKKMAGLGAGTAGESTGGGRGGRGVSSTRAAGDDPY